MKLHVNDFVSSESSKVNQKIGWSKEVMYSATNDDFPYPAGAAISVTPGRLASTLERIDFRERKFGGSTGGNIRERLTPEITPARATPSLATPKGEALSMVMASKNHPIWVRNAGELKG
jgi:hypothetical protein